MRNSLFRPEAVGSRRRIWFGQVVLMQPLSLRLISVAAVVAVALLLLFLCQARYTKYVVASGVLAPDLGLIKIQTPQAGVILERRVREGQHVAEGEVLYVVSAAVMYAPETDPGGPQERTAALLGKLQARQDLIMADQAQANRHANRSLALARARLSSLQAELAQMDSEVVIQQERLKSKSEQYDRNVQAQQQGFLSSLALQQRYDELLEQRARTQSMQRGRTALERELAVAQAGLDEQSGSQALTNSQYRRQLLDIEQDRITRESNKKVLITAPQPGLVAAVRAEPGQRVDSQTLLTLVPRAAVLEAQVYMSSAAIGRLHAGQEAILRFAAFPYQQYGAMRGTVREISHTTLSALEQSQELGFSGPSSEARYRVKVELPSQQFVSGGTRFPLRTGMLVDVQLPQETRSLIEWILEPLYTLRNRA